MVFQRVRLSNSTPEIIPFQAPARARMWRCIAFSAAGFGRVNTPPSSGHLPDTVGRLLVVLVFLFIMGAS
jgi:hypothetical protein